MVMTTAGRRLCKEWERGRITLVGKFVCSLVTKVIYALGINDRVVVIAERVEL